MDCPALASVRAKIDRSIHHFGQVESIIDAALFKHDAEGGLAVNYDSEGKKFSIEHPKRDPLDPSLPLIIGDCIHNLRSALDHLVLQLARLNPLTAAAAETMTAFPVYLNPKQFNNFVRDHVRPFISSTALAQIENLQPYATGNHGDKDILWVLSQLDVIDKHRLLIVVEQSTTMESHSITSNFPVRISENDFGKWKPMVGGTKLMTIDVSAGAKGPGKMKMEISSANRICLADTGMDCDDFPVQMVLSNSILFVQSIVATFGIKFFGE